MMDENSKPNENIKFSDKGKNVKKNVKNSIIVILVYNSTFYFYRT